MRRDAFDFFFPLFPDGVQTVLNYSPFAGLMDLPFRLYIGHIPAEEVGGVLLRQIGWTAAFIAFGRWLLRRGTRVLVTQGG